MASHNKRKHYGLRRFLAFLFVIAIIYFAVIGISRGYHIFMTSTGRQSPDIPSTVEYPVRGVDVSYYQGNIDWNAFAEQGISFAFVKATEGVDYIDPNFYQNWAGAREAGVYVGAYHYFRFEDSGADQAEAFINAVPKTENTLPPVIDVELYPSLTETPDAKAVREELRVMLETLEAYYGVTPIVYTAPNTYYSYAFTFSRDYFMWRCNYYYEPYSNWTFWQYTDDGELEGYDGDQPYIDLDVYSGDMETFRQEFGLT